MSRVLLINGSPHKNGCTARALTEMIHVFEKEGIETELLHIGAMDIRGCIGCGYEIYTKAAFHLLMKEYVRISRIKKEAQGMEKVRLKKLLLQGILPAAREMVVSLPLLYPGAETGILLEMMERGMRDADGGRLTGF